MQLRRFTKLIIRILGYQACLLLVLCVFMAGHAYSASLTIKGGVESGNAASEIYRREDEERARRIREEIRQERLAQEMSGDSGSQTYKSDTRKSSGSSGSAKAVGVKKVYDGGYKAANGTPIYVIECNNGRRTTASQKDDGSWMDQKVIARMGYKYDGLSVNQMAELYCR